MIAGFYEVQDLRNMRSPCVELSIEAVWVKGYVTRFDGNANLINNLGTEEDVV